MEIKIEIETPLVTSYKTKERKKVWNEKKVIMYKKMNNSVRFAWHFCDSLTEQNEHEIELSNLSGDKFSINNS